MSNNIQVSNQFEPSGVIFSALKKNKNGGKSVVLTRSDKKKLYLQLPFMRSPFGLSAFTDESTNKTSYSLDLSFDNDNEEAQELANKLRELDEIILNTVATNSKEWLGKKYDIVGDKLVIDERQKIKIVENNGKVFAALLTDASLPNWKFIYIADYEKMILTTKLGKTVLQYDCF